MASQSVDVRLPLHDFRRLLFRALVIPALVLSLVAGVLCILFIQQTLALGHVQHTQDVIAQTDALEILHLELALATREYLLTGRESPGLNHAQRAAQIVSAFNALTDLVADNPTQVTRFRVLQIKSRDWRAALDRLVIAHRPATGAIALPEAAALAEIRHDLHQAQSMEESIRDVRATRAARATYWLIAGSLFLLAFAAFILIYWGRAQLHELARRYAALLHDAHQHAFNLERVNHALHALVEASPLPIIALDSHARVTLWNPAAATVFGWSAGEVLGEFLPHVPPDQTDSVREIFERSMRGEHIMDMELVRQTRSGQRLILSFASAPLRDAQGRTIGMIGISTDMTARKRAEIELRDAKESAEAASRAKDQFLAVLSHELRTPLTPALTVLQMLEGQPQLPDQTRQDIALARRNIELEARLIDDLLDLTRINRDKLKLLFETLDLHAVLRNALGVCREEISAKKLQLNLDFAARQHFVSGDPARLQQIFWNLLKNAVKFTPAGGALTVRTFNPDGDPEAVAVEIADTGIGIPPEILPRIFEPFEQGKQSITKRFGGLGLGLAISRALVLSHNGTLTAHSPGLGLGSTFIIHFPTTTLVPHAPELPPPAAAASHPALRILVVEDHEDTARVMTRLLQSLGHTVVTANCVAAALHLAAAQTADLIISDIGLPDGTGVELLREIRKTSAIPAIALSGFGMETDIAQSRAAGFSNHLTKPVDIHKLERAIAQTLTHPAPTP